MDDLLKWRIGSFFSFWRQRLSFITSLDVKQSYYEANVLIWASLDALSNAWWKSSIKKQCWMFHDAKKCLQFNYFLEEYGGEYFKYLSLPDIWLRVDEGRDKDTKSLNPETLAFLKKVGERKDPTPITKYLIRQVSDDTSIQSIYKQIVENLPDAESSKLQKWLSYSQYGSIAYKELRCSYIHEGQPGKNSHSFPLYGYEFRPTYLYGKYDTPAIMSFSPKFMMTVLSEAIDKFEANSLEQEVDPIPIEI